MVTGHTIGLRCNTCGKLFFKQWSLALTFLGELGRRVTGVRCPACKSKDVRVDPLVKT